MDNEMAKKETHSVAELTALVEAQRKQIERLEKQLKYSQDKNLALNTLIDVVEEQGIKVRKKLGSSSRAPERQYGLPYNVLL